MKKLLLAIALFLVVQAGQAYDLIEPIEGNWWNQQERGRGVTVDYRETDSDRQWVINLFMYNEEGNAAWYQAFASTSFEGIDPNRFMTNLYQFPTGQCADCEYDYNASEDIREVGFITWNQLEEDLAEICWSINNALTTCRFMEPYWRD